ncbi:Fic family protein [Candidatus Sumerlaeota bacterium]|nr:Fic family protein [Candidatus Sumerlaeota bacterium]
MTIHYKTPENWIAYERGKVQESLLRCWVSILTLTKMPLQKSWADELQRIQLKREVAGTSRIEGAEFTEKELDRALIQSPEQLETRSQKQAAAALLTYRWISGLPSDVPVDESLVFEIHRRIVSNCDDDHCPPGILRGPEANVTFGSPIHRGIEGGQECTRGIQKLVEMARTEFRAHDPIIQALAFHYHFAAMHPFLDGNGRTARALEALLLQRLGLRDTLFIAMSNYYYEEKAEYLKALSETRARNHDLTPFLEFALKGIEAQCSTLLNEIQEQLKKALFRNTVSDLFGRLQSPRKRVVSNRQVEVLYFLLEQTQGGQWSDIEGRILLFYSAVRNPRKALFRDIGYLIVIGALLLKGEPEAVLSVNLDWPTQITETEFFKSTKKLPKGKIFGFLSR